MIKCDVCERMVVQLWRDYETMDRLCDDCLDRRLEEERGYDDEDD